jgi:L-ascorbate metabolism protein UlaG (beta-lactamase superfamily)
MTIKKYPQSCLFITIGNARILIDPSSLKFDTSFLNEWKKANAVLITHRHPDHVNADAVRYINAPIYSTKEVQSAFKDLKIKTVRAGSSFTVNGVKITVTNAVHGFHPAMKTNGLEIFENIGFIINEGKNRVYYTGDTICFNNDIAAEYVIAPTSGNCVTMDAGAAAAYAKMVGAKKLFVVHFDGYPLAPDTETVLRMSEIEYEIMQNGKEYKI